MIESKCYLNYYNNKISIKIKTGVNTFNFSGYKNEKQLVCIIRPVDFLKKVGYEIVKDNISNYEIEKDNKKIEISKVSCTEIKRTIPYLLNNIYLGEFCEKTKTDFEKVNENEYIVYIIGNMKASDKLIEFLKGYESFEPEAYTPANDGTITIGYGTVIQNRSKEYPLGEEAFNKYMKYGISKEEATKLLKEEVKAKEVPINDFIKKTKVILTQNQFDAFVSLAYNFTSVFFEKKGKPLSYVGNFLNYMINQGIPKPSELFDKYSKNGVVISKALEDNIIDNYDEEKHNYSEYFEKNILDISGVKENRTLGLQYRRIDELEIFYYSDYTINKNRNKETLKKFFKAYFIN